MQFIGLINTYSQRGDSTFISISVDENNWSNEIVILHYNANADTMASHPGGAELMDYLVETPDSSSYILSYGDFYVFTKMEKSSNQWAPTIKRMGRLRPSSLTQVNQQTNNYSIKILDYDTIETTKNGVVEKLQLQEKEFYMRKEK